MKKNLRIVIAVMSALFFFVIRFVPPTLNLEWIPGWPAFLSQIICYGCWIFVFIWVAPLLKTPQMEVRVVFGALFAVIVVAAGIWTSFFRGVQVTGYMHSPNRKNTAVVIVHKSTTVDDSEAIYPVRAKLLYERKSENYVFRGNPMKSTCTYKWIDEGTMEIVIDYGATFDGKSFVITEYIRW